MEKVVVVSGGFDPLHIGHIELFKKARELGDKLIVIVNSDEFLISKKGYCFMSVDERLEIIESLECVDEVFECIDKDNSVCRSLEFLSPGIFANGGDRFVNDIPEREVCEKLGIKMVFGLGEKIQSSSDLVKRARRFHKQLEMSLSITETDLFKGIIELVAGNIRDERIDLEVREEIAEKVNELYEKEYRDESGE